MRHVFIINPAAGRKNRTRQLMEQIETVFPAGEVEILVTQGTGDAERLARAALEQGDPVRLYACGGDGTLNEVVNAVAGKDWAAITNVPMGTGNDFLRLFGKEGKKRFTDLVALREGEEYSFDLIDCNGKLGLNTVCVGVDARVAEDVHRFKRLPLIGKKLAYILSLISTVLKGITRNMTVEMGSIHRQGETTLVCVCNGQYYGGGFRPIPEARPDDGILDVLMVKDVSLLEFAGFVGKYAAGRYKECPERLVTSWHGDGVTISSKEEMVAVVDGEVLRDRVFHIKLSPQKVNFFIPKGVTYSAEKAVATVTM